MIKMKKTKLSGKLHAFSEASKKGFGVRVYVRSVFKSGNV